MQPKFFQGHPRVLCLELAKAKKEKKKGWERFQAEAIWWCQIYTTRNWITKIIIWGSDPAPDKSEQAIRL
jgi:uracil DNA glycosylase